MSLFNDDEIYVMTMNYANKTGLLRCEFDDDTIIDFLHKYEEAVMQKLREQKPVAWGITIDGEMCDAYINKDVCLLEFERRNRFYPETSRKLVNLYANQAPSAPEVPLESIVRLLNKAFDYEGDVFEILHNEATDILAACESMLAAARSE